MKRILVLTGATAVILGAMAVPALASGAEPDAPGGRDCKGQTTAWVAQGFGGQVEARGIGNVADLMGLTVEDAHTRVDAFCTTEPA